ncbi:hypothetical protein BDN72DRAFT_901147 [Pluteus cervinus]|uniref:Uncharacterized protein n=1 Tax=Pluteus cervinus TaxID=181527 RepID=A0ACD3AGA9_9AGAR|nr:hypothetical protein BDN72DRAFT_901147 [Pluteus cervinus]
MANPVEMPSNIHPAVQRQRDTKDPGGGTMARALEVRRLAPGATDLLPSPLSHYHRRHARRCGDRPSTPTSTITGKTNPNTSRSYNLVTTTSPSNVARQWQRESERMKWWKCFLRVWTDDLQVFPWTIP